MPSTRPFTRAAVMLLSLGIFAIFASASASADADSASSVASTAATVSASVDPWLAQQLNQYAGAQYGPYQGGVWSDSNTSPVSPWSCDNGPPATVAATLYVLGGESNAAYLNEAETTINTAIANEQSANGGFIPPSWDSTSEGSTTMWFGVEMGTTYELLSPYLDPATKASWQNSLAMTADYLINSGSTTWYANGNLNVGYTELLWFAWKATGESQFLTAYNASWNFVLDPPQARWAKDGWYTVAAPSDASATDGQGYLAETGSGGTGWDPYYATLQLDILARLYLFSDDPRALQAANMIMNMELPLLNLSTWVLNTSDGTRHTGVNSSEFLTSGFAVLALEGGRTDLLSDVLPQLAQYKAWYGWTGQTDNPAFRRAFGNSIDTIALAAALANPAQQSLLSSVSAPSSGVTDIAPLAALSPATIAVGGPAGQPVTTTAGTTGTTSTATAGATNVSVTPTSPTSGAAAATGKSPSAAQPTGSRSGGGASAASAPATSSSNRRSHRRPSHSRRVSRRRHHHGNPRH